MRETINRKVKHKNGITLVEVLAVIVLLALLIVLLTARIGDTLDRPKDLEVQRDFKKYEDAATALLPTNSDFTKDNINKFIDNALKLSSGDKSNGLNPYKSSYRLIVENKDKFRVESDKYRNGSIIETVTLTITRTNGKISSETTIKENSGGSPISPTEPQPPPANVTDYYTFTDIGDRYEVGLTTEFREALDDDRSFKDWVLGTPLPNPGSMYAGLPVTSMYEMFDSVTASVLDLSHFDTSNVEDMSGMFGSSTAGEIDVSSFDTSKVTNMRDMFWDTWAEELDLSSFDTSKVVDMTCMFDTSRATKIDLSSFNTISLELPRFMFSESAVVSLDIRHFNTDNVINMEGMFYGTKFTELDLSKFNTSKVVSMSSMFGSSNIKNLDLSSFDTSNLTNTSSMFRNMDLDSLDLSSFDVSNVKFMSGTFEDVKIDNLDLSNFNTISSTNMSYMFSGCTAKSINLPFFNTSKVTNMEGMFKDTINLSEIDLSVFDTSKVTVHKYMFSGSSATKGYAKTSEDANELNSTSYKPAGLVFTVK